MKKKTLIFRILARRVENNGVFDVLNESYTQLLKLKNGLRAPAALGRFAGKRWESSKHYLY